MAIGDVIEAFFDKVGNVCLRPVLRVVVRESDGVETTRRKKVMSGVYVATFVVCLLTLGRTPFMVMNGDKLTARWLGFVVAFATVLTFGSHFLYTKTISDKTIAGTLYGILLAFLINDWGGAALDSLRIWPLAIILIDISLICGTDKSVSYAILVSLSLWFFVTTLEAIFRFGLYDFEYFLDTQEFRHDWYSCEKIPCKRKTDYMLITMAVQIVVYLIDYHVTSKFATGMRAEHDKIEAAIHAAQDIATSLSRFDLIAAESTINTASLPEPLHDAFSHILENLRMYRPYLPQSCLVVDSKEQNLREVSGVFSNPYSVGKEESASINHAQSPPSRTWHPNEASTVIGDSSLSRMSTDSITRPHHLCSSIEKRNAAFVVFNEKGTHQAILDNVSEFQDKYEMYLTVVLAALNSHNGVVNHVLGDHVNCSFNTAKKCVNYVTSAAAAAIDGKEHLETKNIDVSIGVSSGWAFCGPLGTSELKSLATIGPAPVTASYIEKYCNTQNHSILCTGYIYKEIAHAFSLKIVLTKLSIPGVESVVLVYSMLQMDRTTLDVEWMYQLQGKEWDRYNEGARNYLLGKNEEALRILGSTENAPLTGSETELLQMIKDNREVSVRAMS